MMISMEEQIKNLPPPKFYISDFFELPEEIENSKKNLKNMRKNTWQSDHYSGTWCKNSSKVVN